MTTASTPTDPATEGVPYAVEDIHSYSGLHHARALVYAPRNIDELRQVLAYARATGRRVTFRAAGHSFDGQSIGDDVVVTLIRMDAIAPDRAAKTVRVGPGARWGRILAKLEPLALVPAVTVSTEHATAGGTLSGDCLSRFSPAYGKEGSWIVSFDLVLMDGTLLTCTPPRPGTDYEAMSPGERAFCGVIGGLGYLGAVVSITYRLLSLAPMGPRTRDIGVRTLVRKYRSFRHLARDLVPTARRTVEEDSRPEDPDKLDAIFSAVFVPPEGDPYVLFFTSAFTTRTDRRRMLAHQPAHPLRPFTELLMRAPAMTRLSWPIFFKTYEDREEYVDDLEGYTFFMDGNVRTKELGARLGFSLKTVQQTFIVPSGPGALRGWDAAEDDLVEWLEHAAAFFRSRDLQPTLQDVLYLPEDDRFLLSSSYGLSGFAVSYAFETSDPVTIAQVQAAFTELADTLWDKFSGRVYLVKNVNARRETLRAMYGEGAKRFFALKRELDPEGRLTNAFLERTFGDMAEA